MQSKKINMGDQILSVEWINGRITFTMNDHIMYSGIPFQDVVNFKDVEVDENGVLVVCLIQKVIKTINSTTTSLIEEIRQIDSSLFSNIENNTAEEPEVEEELEESSM